MKTLKTLSALLLLPALLAACSGGEEQATDTSATQTSAEPATEAPPTPELDADVTVGAQPDAQTNPRIIDALDFVGEGAGVAVFGQNIVLNIPARDGTTASLAREVALSASNMSPSTSFTVFVVEGDATATEVPGEGAYVCAVSASENQVQDNTCS